MAEVQRSTRPMKKNKDRGGHTARYMGSPSNGQMLKIQYLRLYVFGNFSETRSGNSDVVRGRLAFPMSAALTVS